MQHFLAPGFRCFVASRPSPCHRPRHALRAAPRGYFFAILSRGQSKAEHFPWSLPRLLHEFVYLAVRQPAMIGMSGTLAKRMVEDSPIRVTQRQPDRMKMKSRLAGWGLGRQVSFESEGMAGYFGQVCGMRTIGLVMSRLGSLEIDRSLRDDWCKDLRGGW